MKVIYTILLALLIMFVITFSLENASPICIKYYDYFQRCLPTYMIIFIAFLIGVIFTGFMGIVERFRLTRTIKLLNKTIRDLRKEINENESRKSPEGLENFIVTPKKGQLSQ
jgi:uncharacterized integral membrane protein